MKKKLYQAFVNILIASVIGVFVGCLWKAVEYHHSNTDCKGGDCEWYWCPNRTK